MKIAKVEEITRERITITKRLHLTLACGHLVDRPWRPPNRIGDTTRCPTCEPAKEKRR